MTEIEHDGSTHVLDPISHWNEAINDMRRAKEKDGESLDIGDDCGKFVLKVAHVFSSKDDWNVFLTSIKSKFCGGDLTCEHCFEVYGFKLSGKLRGLDKTTFIVSLGRQYPILASEPIVSNLNSGVSDSHVVNNSDVFQLKDLHSVNTLQRNHLAKYTWRLQEEYLTLKAEVESLTGSKTELNRKVRQLMIDARRKQGRKKKSSSSNKGFCSRQQKSKVVQSLKRSIDNEADTPEKKKKVMESIFPQLPSSELDSCKISMA